MTIRSQTRIRWPVAAALTLLLGSCRSTAPAGRTASALDAEPVTAVETPQATAATYSNTVKWTTASELDNFGYDVYRGLSPEGPFERVNKEVIAGASTTDEPTRYRFVDDAIDPRATYYYYVESISMSGVRERFTPIGKAPPKIPPADAESGGS